MHNHRTILINLAKFAIPVGIIAYLLYRITPEQWQALTENPKNYPLLISALLIAVCAISISFVRWCMLVRCQGIEFTMLEAFRLGSICFLLNFVSAGSVGGDLFKAIFLAQRRPGKRIAAVASVLVDRGVGLYGVVLLAAGAFLVYRVDPNSDAYDNMNRIKAGTAVVALTGTTVLMFLVFGGAMVDRLIRWGSRLPVVGGLVLKIGPPLRMFHHHPIAFGASIVMSLIVHSMLVLSIYLIARALYPSVPTLGEHFVIVPIGMIASALPIAPAGLGVFEGMIEWLYHAIPAVPTNASGTVVALVFEIVKLVLAVIGIVFYWTAGAEVRQSLEKAEHVGEGVETGESDEG
ncbi:hypothetical protein Pla52n_06240 [Stieleria varia]|uniref:Uncharacterized protein n=2 Tax=Stieleria varia TaxID=2528005 RepID=A0A5C6B9W3_9BACT|nr:hypothetical protein Pla52n_06240 [Stieleria varia]